MSDLREFVNQQKAKISFFGKTTTSSSFPSIKTIRSKLTTGLNGFSLMHSSGDDSDREILTESTGETNGQLPQSRNRRNGGWFSAISNEESVFGMSKIQRIVAFFMSIGAAFVCFGIAVVLLPTIVIQARKFAALNTLGSIMLILSFGFLWGPTSYMKHMFSEQRRHVTVAYLITVIATLYFSLWVCLYFS
uniref:Vesicle transport protein n=1 Tax=Elaeophora elaphi TaxID=1147741 RepID=A0A0R3RWH4_9BILA